MTPRSPKADGKCWDCRFWSSDFRDDAPDADHSFSRGECRRHAPISGMVGLGRFETLWPQTESDDWCGDFEALKPSTEDGK